MMGERCQLSGFIFFYFCTSFAGIGLSGVSLTNCFDKTKFLLCSRGWETTFDENKTLNRTGKGRKNFIWSPGKDYFNIWQFKKRSDIGMCFWHLFPEFIKHWQTLHTAQMKCFLWSELANINYFMGCCVCANFVNKLLK